MKFHPINKPVNQYMLKVNDSHVINVEEYGNKNGIPMLFLHGHEEIT